MDAEKIWSFFNNYYNKQVTSYSRPYANRWSKTMIGYGPEDTHFVMELTYNYGVTHYERGNDFLGITIQSSESLQRAAANNWPVKEDKGLKYLEAPGGYRFYIEDKPEPAGKGKESYAI